MYVNERVVEKTAFYSYYAGSLVDWCKVFNHVVKLIIIGKAVGIDGITIGRN
jgi:hypothetical protein